MDRVVRCWCFGLLSVIVFAGMGFGQRALTWPEIRDKFEAANLTLRAGQIGIDESRAQEITANLRPNPNLTVAGVSKIRLIREGNDSQLGDACLFAPSSLR